MSAITEQPEPEYGQGVAMEANAAVNPVAEDQQVTVPVSQSEPVSQAGNIPNQGYMPKNRLTLLPPEVTMAKYMRPKTPLQKQYDVGLLWRVLSSQYPDVPVFRNLAKSMTGKEK